MSQCRLWLYFLRELLRNDQDHVKCWNFWNQHHLNNPKGTEENPKIPRRCLKFHISMGEWWTIWSVGIFGTKILEGPEGNTKSLRNTFKSLCFRNGTIIDLVKSYTRTVSLILPHLSNHSNDSQHVTNLRNLNFRMIIILHSCKKKTLHYRHFFGFTLNSN